MTEKLVKIAEFSQSMEAHFSKTRLESEGIECFINDEFTVNMNWLFSNAIGGVKLLVKESDVGRAVEILQQEPAIGGVVEIGSDEPHCPECNSSDVYYEKFSRRAIFASWLLLGIPFPFFKRKWVCRKCRHQWKAR